MSQSNGSSGKSPDHSEGYKADKSVEIDANIRNFAPVARIMKNALPDNAKIAKDAKECMQECVSEFISFITSEGTSDPSPQAMSFNSAGARAFLLTSG